MPSILIVDDDPCTCETLATGLRLAGFRTATATTIEDARSLSKSELFDLLLVDQLLGPTSGLELMRLLRIDGCQIPFTLMSGYMDVATAVAAMRQGAVNALCSPIDINELPQILIADLERFTPWPGEGFTVREEIHYVPDSAIGELARVIAQSSASLSDFPKAELLAHFVGISQAHFSVLCHCCDVEPHQVRDFSRMYRAIWRASVTGQPVKRFLKVGDTRTLRQLLEKAGCNSPSDRSDPVSQFLESQRLLPTDSELPAVLCSLLDIANVWASEVLARREPDSHRTGTSEFVRTSRLLGIEPKAAIELHNILAAIVQLPSANRHDATWTFHNQQLVPPDNPGVQALIRRLSGRSTFGGRYKRIPQAKESD